MRKWKGNEDHAFVFACMGEKKTSLRDTQLFSFYFLFLKEDTRLDRESRPVRLAYQPLASSNFSLRTNQPPAFSQQYFSLRTNHHQPPAKRTGY
jgi:hypothetical protein